MLDNGPHLSPWDVLSLGMFCPWDVLSNGTFCPMVCFVPGTFCPMGRFVPWYVLSLGRLVLGRFVCASFLAVVDIVYLKVHAFPCLSNPKIVLFFISSLNILRKKLLNKLLYFIFKLLTFLNTLRPKSINPIYRRTIHVMVDLLPRKHCVILINVKLQQMVFV